MTKSVFGFANLFPRLTFPVYNKLMLLPLSKRYADHRLGVVDRPVLPITARGYAIMVRSGFIVTLQWSRS